MAFRGNKFLWTDELKDMFLKIFEETGSIPKAANAIGSTTRAIVSERRIDPEFNEACEEANHMWHAKVRDEIIRRAMTGIEEPVFHQGVHMDNKTVYSDGLLTLLAKSELPAFQERTRHDVNVTGGVMLVTAPAKSPELWMEEQEQLAEQRTKQLTEGDEDIIDGEVVEHDEEKAPAISE